MRSPHLLFAVITALAFAILGHSTARAADKYPDTAEGAKAMMSEFLKPGADLKALTNQLRPTAADYTAVFDAPLAQKVAAMYEPLWASGTLVIAPKEGQTELLIQGVPTGEVRQWSKGASAILPGGYQGIATSIKDGHTLYAFKFVKPGETMGMAFDGLTFVNGHWCIIPKPWRAAQAK